MKRWSWLIGLLCFLVVGCGSYRTIIREIGYKGKARLDAYLAAERFLERQSQAEMGVAHGGVQREVGAGQRSIREPQRPVFAEDGPPVELEAA